MTDTTDVATTEHPTTPHHHTSRLNQALAWVGIVAGGLFVVAGIFLSGFFLSWSEHMHMGTSHPAAMAKESKDCCADMKPGEKPADMKPGDHEMKPSGMMKPGGMTEPQPAH
jgi:hypothetical protein